MSLQEKCLCCSEDHNESGVKPIGCSEKPKKAGSGVGCQKRKDE